MKKLSKDENGFGAVEIIIIVVIIILLIVVGCLIYRNHHKNNTSAGTSGSQSQQAMALANIKTFYKNYLAASGTGSNNTYSKTAVSDGILTQNGYDTAGTWEARENSDEVTCSQNPLSYSAYTFTTPTISDTTGSSTVSGTSASGSKTTIDVSLQKINNKWAISGFTCPDIHPTSRP